MQAVLRLQLVCSCVVKTPNFSVKLLLNQITHVPPRMHRWTLLTASGCLHCLPSCVSLKDAREVACVHNRVMLAHFQEHRKAPPPAPARANSAQFAQNVVNNYLAGTYSGRVAGANASFLFSSAAATTTSCVFIVRTGIIRQRGNEDGLL